jgi:hypothetical protein
VVQLISEQATSVSLALVVMWFYNKLVIDFLTERKEMIEAIRLERKEWLATSERYLNELFTIGRQNIDALGAMKAETHALRNKLTEFMLSRGQRDHDKP